MNLHLSPGCTDKQPPMPTKLSKQIRNAFYFVVSRLITLSVKIKLFLQSFQRRMSDLNGFFSLFIQIIANWSSKRFFPVNPLAKSTRWNLMNSTFVSRLFSKQRSCNKVTFACDNVHWYSQTQQDSKKKRFCSIRVVGFYCVLKFWRVLAIREFFARNNFSEGGFKYRRSQNFASRSVQIS